MWNSKYLETSLLRCMLAFPDFGNVLATHCIDSEANPMIRDFFWGPLYCSKRIFIHISISAKCKYNVHRFIYMVRRKKKRIFYGQADRMGGNPNSLRYIYSQDIPKGRPGTFQQDVRGHSNRMSCNVLFLHFNLIFVPPMHICEQWIGVRQLWLYNMLVITL